jgi:hypothetical protein
MKDEKDTLAIIARRLPLSSKRKIDELCKLIVEYELRDAGILVPDSQKPTVKTQQEVQEEYEKTKEPVDYLEGVLKNDPSLHTAGGTEYYLTKSVLSPSVEVDLRFLGKQPIMPNTQKVAIYTEELKKLVKQLHRPDEDPEHMTAYVNSRLAHFRRSPGAEITK